MTLDSSATASALLGSGRVRLIRRDLKGNKPTVVALPAGALTVTGSTLTVDFGAAGVGGPYQDGELLRAGLRIHGCRRGTGAW